MGGTGAGDPGVGARRRRRAGRDCAGGGREQRASSSHGDLAAAVDQAAANPLSRAHSARPSHRGDHVDRVAAAAASAAAGARIPFANGVGCGFMAAAQAGTLIGYYLATSLPPLLTAGLLFLTPISFLISTTRNCRLMSDWLALAFGLVLGPLMAAWQMGLDLLWSGVLGGSLAYGIHRLREALK